MIATASGALGARGARRLARCAEVLQSSAKKTFIMRGHEHNEQSPAAGDVAPARSGASPTPASSTKCLGGARATSRSTPRATCRSIPTKDPSRAIDLKQLVDDLQARGIALPLLIRFSDILKHRLGDIHDAFPGGHRAAPVQRPLLLRLPDQGEPAAAGRRGSAQLRRAVPVRPRGRLQAGAARRHRDGGQRHADHLQRLQGRRVHRDGDAGPEDGPQHHSRSSRSTPSSG